MTTTRTQTPPPILAEVVCPRCGCEYEVDGRALLSGTWRICPICYPFGPNVTNDGDDDEVDGEER